MGELVQVKIKGLITTSRYGSMSSGDSLRTDPAYARHLVEELKVADYVTAPKVEAPKEEPQAEQPAPRFEKRHKQKR